MCEDVPPFPPKWMATPDKEKMPKSSCHQFMASGCPSLISSIAKWTGINTWLLLLSLFSCQASLPSLVLDRLHRIAYPVHQSISSNPVPSPPPPCMPHCPYRLSTEQQTDCLHLDGRVMRLLSRRYLYVVLEVFIVQIRSFQFRITRGTPLSD